MWIQQVEYPMDVFAAAGATLDMSRLASVYFAAYVVVVVDLIAVWLTDRPSLHLQH